MKKILLAGGGIVLLLLVSFFLRPGPAVSKSTADEELTAIRQEFGNVLKLSGTTAAREINAIANLLEPGSGMMAIDLTRNSQEFCMLEPLTGRYMIHFSDSPEKTAEDMVYLINPDAFKAAGLDVAKLPALPTELGKMTPFQWYYYDGKAVEPHHGRPMGREYLLMAVDVK